MIWHRTLPADLTPLGCFILRCWFDIAGGRGGGINDENLNEKPIKAQDKADNGVGRLIMRFACGFDDTKSPFALIGMPSEGKVADTSNTRCFNCIQHIADPAKPLT